MSESDLTTSPRCACGHVRLHHNDDVRIQQGNCGHIGCNCAHFASPDTDPLDFTREDDARTRVLLGEGDISYKAVVTLAAVARIVAETVWYTMPLNTLNELLETLQRNTAEALAAIDGSI